MVTQTVVQLIVQMSVERMVANLEDSLSGKKLIIMPLVVAKRTYAM